MEALLTIGYGLIGVFAVGFFVAMHRAFWRRYYRLDTDEDEVHRVVCDDGWEIRLYRYCGVGDAALQSNPLVLCHGFGANRFNMDFHPEVSLARYLNRLGFEVWLVELRGCSDATRTPPAGRRAGEVLFEDFVDLDVPAAIRHVLLHSGADGVHWVGHSMGGMVGLAFAQGPGAPLLKSLVTIGSPGRLELPGFLHFLCNFAWILGWLPQLPIGLLSNLAAPFYFRLPIDPMAIRQANLSPARVRYAMSNVLSDMPMTLTRQFARMQINGGDIVAAQDGRNFSRGLGSIERPLLSIAGWDDRIAPPRSVRCSVDQASGGSTRWVVVGDDATAPGYGHGDLLIGDMAPEHVFPHVGRWIAERSGLAEELGFGSVADVEVVATSLESMPSPGETEAAEIAQEVPDDLDRNIGGDEDPVVGERRLRERRLQKIRDLERDRRTGRDRRRAAAPPGWENALTTSSGQRRRPHRLHRSPVDGHALAEALRLVEEDAGVSDEETEQTEVESVQIGSED